MRKATVLALALVVAVASGCEDATGPDDGLDLEALAAMALEADELTGLLIDDVFLGAFAGGDIGVAAADPRPFSRTRECPAGGSLTVSGQIDRTRNGEGTVEIDVTGAGTWAACARVRRDLTVTVDGAFTFEAYRKRVNGAPVGPQTSHKAGSFTWTRSDGKSGECSFDLTSTRNPDAGTRTLTGTMCGREIDRTVEWRKRG
jgi:hypothetical protein